MTEWHHDHREEPNPWEYVHLHCVTTPTGLDVYGMEQGYEYQIIQHKHWGYSRFSFARRKALQPATEKETA